jgi:hypothetical protein
MLLKKSRSEVHMYSISDISTGGNVIMMLLSVGLPLLSHKSWYSSFSGLLSQMEYSVFQEWFEFLTEHQKPHLDLISMYTEVILFCTLL